MEDIKKLLSKHLQFLCEEIGARPTGSAKNKKAVEYACNEFEKLGFNVTTQDFDCMDWQNEGSELVIDGQNIKIIAAEYSLPCDTEADFICIDSVGLLKHTDLSGKIAVLYGDLCKESLMPKNFTFWNPEEHQIIINLLETKKPVAIITVSPIPDIPMSIIQDGDFEIPCGATTVDLLDIFLKSKTRESKFENKNKAKTFKGKQCYCCI